jgi:hypothetical protein
VSNLKRIIGALITVLIIYVIYYDLTEGTLPMEKRTDESVSVSSPLTDGLPYVEEEVKPGDTVLSIVERNGKNPLPTSISKVIADFEKLNDGKKPEDIQIGKQYKFPIYND